MRYATRLILLRDAILPLQIVTQIEGHCILELGGRRISLTRHRVLPGELREIIFVVAKCDPTVKYVLS